MGEDETSHRKSLDIDWSEDLVPEEMLERDNNKNRIMGKRLEQYRPLGNGKGKLLGRLCELAQISGRKEAWEKIKESFNARHYSSCLAPSDVEFPLRYFRGRPEEGSARDVEDQMQDDEAEEKKAQVEEACEEECKTENDDLCDEPEAPTASTSQASSHREGTSRVRDPLHIPENLYGELEATYQEMTAAVSRYQDVWRRLQEVGDPAASTAQLQRVEGGIKYDARVSDVDLDYDSSGLEDELQGDEDSGAESDGDDLFQPWDFRANKSFR